MMTHDPHTFFFVITTIHILRITYFAAPYQKLYRAHPISSYSMLLCMLYHLLLKYVNQVCTIFPIPSILYHRYNYYMSVGFKVKYLCIT